MALVQVLHCDSCGEPIGEIEHGLRTPELAPGKEHFRLAPLNAAGSEDARRMEMNLSYTKGEQSGTSSCSLTRFWAQADFCSATCLATYVRKCFPVSL